MMRNQNRSRNETVIRNVICEYNKDHDKSHIDYLTGYLAALNPDDDWIIYYEENNPQTIKYVMYHGIKVTAQPDSEYYNRILCQCTRELLSLVDQGILTASRSMETATCMAIKSAEGMDNSLHILRLYEKIKTMEILVEVKREQERTNEN